MKKEVVNNSVISLDEIEKQSSFKLFLKRLYKNKIAMLGGIVFLLVCVLAVIAPLIAPYDYLDIDTANKYMRPCAEHLFGTDQYGRDILSRVLYGARWSLSLGVGASLFGAVGGLFFGSIAGYFGGKADMIIMRICDLFQCIPHILLVIVISTVLGPGLVNTIIAMSFGSIWGSARMLRSQILTVRKQEYVEAAKITNNPSPRIILKYILPNSIQPMLIGVCMGVGNNIMSAAGLAFLGLGIQPPLPEWGAMLTDGRGFMRYYPNMILAPLLMISLVLLSVSLFGDGLRDAMDPRLNE